MKVHEWNSKPKFKHKLVEHYNKFRNSQIQATWVCISNCRNGTGNETPDTRFRYKHDTEDKLMTSWSTAIFVSKVNRPRTMGWSPWNLSSFLVLWNICFNKNEEHSPEVKLLFKTSAFHTKFQRWTSALQTYIEGFSIINQTLNVCGILLGLKYNFWSLVPS